ncbi:ty3-gypsy retrotransposon protein [Tanacetum coccineum]
MKWLPKLMGFDYEIVYKKGSKNGAADALSRVDTGSQLLQIVLTSVSTDLLPKIVDSWSNDPSLITLIANLKASKPISKHYSWSNQQLRRKGKLVISNDPALRLSLLTHFHCDSTGGHSGNAATTQRIQVFCYWKKLKRQVKEFVSICDVCQKSKPDLSAYPGLLQPLRIPTLIWSDISMDFAEGLSNSGEKTVIMVVVDRLSKYGHFMALSHPFTAIQVAQFFLDNVYKLHGLPKVIVSYRDKIFLSLFWKELFKMLQVSLHFSTVYHPQTDGQTEVCTGTTSINTTPFEAVYGQPPSSSISYSPGQSKVDSVGRSLSAREAIIQMLQFYLQRAQSRMKAIADSHRTESLACVPTKVLKRRMVKENNILVVYVLIQWSNGSIDDATWELATDLEKRFPDFSFNS